MKNLYFDLAGKVLPYQLPTLLEMVDPDKIVYGSDTLYDESSRLNVSQ